MKNVDEEEEENDKDDGNEDEDDDENDDAAPLLLAIFETMITLDLKKTKVATIITVKWRRVDTPPYDMLASSDHYKRPGM